MPGISIIWFRDDLRVVDNPALAAASARGNRAVAVFVREQDAEPARATGRASRWWLHHSLTALRKGLARINVPLVLRSGSARIAIPRIVSETGADAVFWNRRYGSAEIETDKAVKASLQHSGIAAESRNGSLLFEPWTVLRGGTAPYRVFTPFWKAARAGAPPADPFPAPGAFPSMSPGETGSEDLDDWNLLPTEPNRASGFEDNWEPGEAGACERLQRFLSAEIANYASERDRPDIASTSRLSPHLRFGEISPRVIWQAAAHRVAAGRISERHAGKFLSELGWREFSYHLLFYNPDLAERNFQDRFDAFPWQSPGTAFDDWRRGRTGYPLVDAGMRELWHTGWMHNRVRMVAASFLAKHLRIDWREGERWFWDTLVDADPASNPAGWQWVAGCGADAAPYFRIFNPIIQGEKFDPDGDYISRWIPELRGLPVKYIHRPWDAPEQIRNAAGSRLGEGYPAPVVDHSAARTAALEAFKSLQQDAA